MPHGQKICLKNCLDYLDQETLFNLAKIYNIKFEEVACCQNMFCFNSHPLLFKEINLNLSFLKLIHFVIFNSVIVCIFYPCVIVFYIWCKFLKWFCYYMKDDRTYLKYDHISSDVGTLFSQEPFLKMCDCKIRVHLISYRWYPKIKTQLAKKLN